jgi:hypothetical protein
VARLGAMRFLSDMRIHAWSVSAVLLSLALFGAASSAEAQLPDGIRYDDGFAYFSLSNHRSVSNNVPTAAWSLAGSARVIGANVARGSAFKFVLKSGRRVLGQIVCEGGGGYGGLYAPGAPTDRFDVAHCTDRQMRLDATGPITVEVYFIDDATDEEHLARTHVVDVRKLTRLRHTGQSEPDEFFINYHAETAAVLIEQVPFRHFRLHSQGIGSSANSNQVLVHMPWSLGETNLFQAKMRCTVDGQRIELQNDGVTALDPEPHSQQTATQITLDGRRTVGEYVRFVYRTLVLPITFGTDRATGGFTRIEEHPGAWECNVRHPDRRTLRTFRFTVLPNGSFAPHAEEAAGLSLGERVHLIDVDVPADSPIDERTDPASVRAGAFYGRAWATDAGRQTAARIPQIGAAFPSTVQPRSGPARRGRR